MNLGLKYGSTSDATSASMNPWSGAFWSSALRAAENATASVRLVMLSNSPKPWHVQARFALAFFESRLFLQGAFEDPHGPAWRRAEARARSHLGGPGNR